MSRGDQQSSRLTRTSSFGQTNIKNKLETFEAILDTLGQELHQLRQDTTVHVAYNVGFTKQLQQTEPRYAWIAGQSHEEAAGQHQEHVEIHKDWN